MCTLFLAIRFGGWPMSKGPGRVMRAIIEATEAEPTRRFTIEELAALAYPGAEIVHKHMVEVRAAVAALRRYRRVKAWPASKDNGKQGWRLCVTLKTQGERDAEDAPQT
jgi:hypothetical protein